MSFKNLKFYLKYFAYMNPDFFEIFQVPYNVLIAIPPLQYAVVALKAAIVVLNLFQVSLYLKCFLHCPNFVLFPI